MMESFTQIIEPKKEIETTNVRLNMKLPNQASVTSVLDELENVLDSELQSVLALTVESNLNSSQTNESIHPKEEIKSISQDTCVLSCSDCGLKTNSEHILSLHWNTKHTHNPDAAELAQKALGKGILCKDRTISSVSTTKSKKQMVKTCELCNLDFSGNRNLVVHYREEHKGKNIFNCDNCDYGSNWPVNFNNHKESRHNPKTYQCDLCEWKSKWKSAFSEHRREKHGIYRKKRSAKSLLKHKTNLLREKSHRKKRDYPCNLCDYIAGIKSLLKEHRRNVHNVGQQKYPCDICSYVAIGRATLRKHEETEHPGVEHPCNICSYTGKSMEHLSEHHRRMHGETEFSCSSCDFVTNIRPYLAIHTEKEHSGVEFPCDICSYIAKTKKYLDAHIKRIHGSEEYVCDSCAYVSKSKEYLFNHILMNHKEKRYPCSQCNYKAAYKSQLDKHIQRGTHNVKRENVQKTETENRRVAKKYLCDKCDYQATKLKYVDKHRESTHEH